MENIETKIRPKKKITKLKVKESNEIYSKYTCIPYTVR